MRIFSVLTVLVFTLLLLTESAQAVVAVDPSLVTPPSSSQPVFSQLPQSDLYSDSVEMALPTASLLLIASDSASAAPSAQVEPQGSTETRQDITTITPNKKEKMAEVLDQNPIRLSWSNILQFYIRGAVDRGLPANIIVLLLLFPIIALVIAFSRHIIGLSGFGVYTPAVLSVAFVSTGIITGILLFLVVLTAAILTHSFVKKLKLQALPRTALLFWGVSCVILFVLILSAYLGMSAVINVSIFPILIVILLTENFMETQLFSSQKATIRLTAETLLTATLCSLLISMESLQVAVILNPELTLSLVALANFVIGKYSGLRLIERLRFKSIIE